MEHHDKKYLKTLLIRDDFAGDEETVDKIVADINQLIKYDFCVVKKRRYL